MDTINKIILMFSMVFLFLVICNTASEAAIVNTQANTSVIFGSENSSDSDPLSASSTFTTPLGNDLYAQADITGLAPEIIDMYFNEGFYFNQWESGPNFGMDSYVIIDYHTEADLLMSYSWDITYSSSKPLRGRLAVSRLIV